MNELKATDLRVGWGTKEVALLPELSLCAGSVIALAGPNGAGKTTALKTLARQINPLGGVVTVDQRNAFELSQKEFAKQVAYVPQIIDPSRKISVRELVSLGRNPHQAWWQWGLNAEGVKSVDAALEETDTSGLADKAVSELSGGERQRVAIAVALAQQTPFLLMDEPAAHLDFKHQLQLLALVNKLRSKGLGVLLVLHDLGLIARTADHVILLQKGETRSTIAAAGTVDEVFNEATLKSVYEVQVAINRDPTTGLKTYIALSAKSNSGAN